MTAMKLLPAILLLVPEIALAQPESTDTGFDHAVPAVANAFEIGVSAGFSQGLGKFGNNMGLSFQDLGILGPTFELGLGYRMFPELSVGAYGSVAGYQRGSTADELSLSVFGARAGVQAVLHLRPTRAVDPWLSLGTGWTSLWILPTDGKTSSFQGLDLVRIQVGVDYRLSKDVAIAPAISGGFSTFLAEDYTMPDLTEISGKRIQFTAFAGLTGRFDVGGTR